MGKKGLSFGYSSTKDEREGFGLPHMPVIASGSEAIQSGLRNPGLLRRFAPRNDEGYLTRAELFHQRPRLGQILVEHHDATRAHQPDAVGAVHTRAAAETGSTSLRERGCQYGYDSGGAQ